MTPAQAYAHAQVVRAQVKVAEWLVLPPMFGSSPGAPDPNGDTIPDWSQRADLVPDGFINILDVNMALPPFFGYECAP